MAKPEKLPPNQFDHFYKGGYKIGSLRGGPGGPMRPEEWIGSTTTRYGETDTGLSKLSSGELLVDVIGRESEAWLGREHLNTFGSSTEILVKLLDPDQALPVHFRQPVRINSAYAAGGATSYERTFLNSGVSTFSFISLRVQKKQWLVTIGKWY